MSDPRPVIIVFIIVCAVAICAVAATEMVASLHDTEVAKACVAAGGSWTESAPRKPATCIIP